MWMKSRPDITTTTSRMLTVRFSHAWGFGGGGELTKSSGSSLGSTVMEVMDLRWLQKVNQRCTMPWTPTIATTPLELRIPREDDDQMKAMK